MLDTQPPLLVIGPPNTRRTEMLLAAARAVGWHNVSVLGYPQALDLLADKGTRKQGSQHPAAGTFVRLDSPQDDVPTGRCILRLGIAPMATAGRTPLSAAEIARLVPARGELLHPLQWFLGFRRLLGELAKRWDGHATWMSHPHAVATMFDKAACRRLWAAAGLPVPASPACPRAYDELRAHLQSPHARLFVKLRYGYSAAGAVALEWCGSRVRAITTVETAIDAGRTRFLVCRRPRILLKETEIAQLINALAEHEIVVEQWLPKAQWKGLSFDVRVVLIRGRVAHVVGRASTAPFTNLNLGARRMSREVLMQHLRDWDALAALAEQAAACFPTAGTMGLDVLVRPCRRRLVLLEANAFGDYLPGLRYEELTTYEAAFHAWSNR